ncbi:hypothetical protein [Leptospira adleri]|uniref:Uncharacterized protein n=1 Tax=Leptospira adleri TaxID=2023186 RepID=A0A2M9YNA4_9LEPT|nr:hypothetical protein [Leptospira adleri]PJZ53027.1 hypothetical protein CH380_11440 [Leptospira adleri]PJZ62584.1 hypothetical protein CH376_07220 [Leptospira adleri]
MIRYSFFWLLLLVFAFLNATIRELTYKNFFGEFLSHQISVFTGIVLLSIPIAGIAKFFPFSSARQSFLVGILWLILTEIFEYTMIVLWSRKPNSDFFQAHDVFHGELWIFILIWIVVSPYLFYRAFGRS